MGEINTIKSSPGSKQFTKTGDLVDTMYSGSGAPGAPAAQVEVDSNDEFSRELEKEPVRKSVFGLTLTV